MMGFAIQTRGICSPSPPKSASLIVKTITKCKRELSSNHNQLRNKAYQLCMLYLNLNLVEEKTGVP